MGVGTETVLKITTTKKGERVIMDPAVTISRVYLYFYLMVNMGSLTGSIGMVYAEKYVGFWLSFLLPTLMLCKSFLESCKTLLMEIGLCPMVIIACKKRYKLYPPSGSVLPKAFKLWKLAMSKCWSWNPVGL